MAWRRTHDATHRITLAAQPRTDQHHKDACTRSWTRRLGTLHHALSLSSPDQARNLGCAFSDHNGSKHRMVDATPRAAPGGEGALPPNPGDVACLAGNSSMAQMAYALARQPQVAAQQAEPRPPNHCALSVVGEAMRHSSTAECYNWTSAIALHSHWSTSGRCCESMHRTDGRRKSVRNPTSRYAPKPAKAGLTTRNASVVWNDAMRTCVGSVSCSGNLDREIGCRRPDLPQTLGLQPTTLEAETLGLA